MKYIVKKEMPGAKVGDILETTNFGDLLKDSGHCPIQAWAIKDALDQGFIEPYEEKPKASSTEVSKFIKEMKYIERSDDSPIMEYLMELARAVEHDLTDNEVSDE